MFRLQFGVSHGRYHPASGFGHYATASERRPDGAAALQDEATPAFPWRRHFHEVVVRQAPNWEMTLSWLRSCADTLCGWKRAHSTARETCL